MKKIFVRYVIVSAFMVSVSVSQAVQLITPKEAKLPEANGALKTRGIARGPGIKVNSPDLGAAEIKSPFDLKVDFESRGGNKIDPASIKITYLKATEVDLTSRMKSAITERGIDFTKAEVPPGEHAVRITVKDVDGRESNSVLNLIVTK